MYALLGVGALLAGASIVSAKLYDEKDGGRDDVYHRSRSIIMSSSVTKSVDAIANLDARDNARLYLKGLSVELANSLSDECFSLMTSQGHEKQVSHGVKQVLTNVKSLVEALAKLRSLPESDFINVVLRHPMRVGTSPKGVSGVEGMTRWLLGGMRAEVEKQAAVDLEMATKVKSYINRGNGVSQKAKNIVLYKILERIPTPHFSKRFPFEDALLAIEHIDDKLVEYESKSEGSSAMTGGSDVIPTSIGEMHDYVVSVARNINK